MGAVMSILRTRRGKVAVAALVAAVVWYFKVNKKLALLRYLTQLAYGLRRYEYGCVDTEKGVYVTTRDGVRLMSSVLFPGHDGRKVQHKHIVLIRTPYDRKLLLLPAERFAERGYVVVLQDTRGRFGSDGDFVMLAADKDDGVDTLRWIKEQSWCHPEAKVGLWGISYLGYVIHALVHGVAEAHAAAKSGKDDSLLEVSAVMPIMCSSDMYTVCFPDRTANMDLLMRWLHLTHYLGGAGFTGKRLSELSWTQLAKMVLFYDSWQEKSAAAAAKQWSYSTMQKEMLGVDELLVPVVTSPTDPYWEVRRHSHAVHNSPAAHFVGGWYDFFLREIISDYEKVDASRGFDDDRPLMLTIGPWHHFESLQLPAFSQLVCWGVDLFDEVMRGRPGVLPRSRVNLFVMQGQPSKGEWRAFKSWPPLSSPHRWYLRGNGSLVPHASEDVSVPPSKYHYDPHEPTPQLRGAVFHPTRGGCIDNQAFEKRGDVVVFTSSPLKQDVEVIGHVSAELHVRVVGGTSADFVARLCDVHPDGSSMNVCDGYCRSTFSSAHEEDVRAVVVDMWATANLFKAGHRIRLQLCSGAHPRIMRNLGTGTGSPDESKNTQHAVEVDIEIYHDAEAPSCVVLPIVCADSLPHSVSHSSLPRTSSQVLLSVLSQAQTGPFQHFSQA